MSPIGAGLAAAPAICCDGLYDEEGDVGDETVPIVPEFPFVPTRDALTGWTTDHERHLIARSAFMNALLRNERVLALFEAWATRYRLREPVGRWARALDALSAHLGLEHRSQLLRTGAGAPRLVVDESDVAAAQAAVHAAARLLRQVESATRAFHRAFATVKVEAEVVAFVRDELKLNWTWLAHDLLDAFVKHMYGAVWGTVIVSRWSLAPPQVQDRVEFTFIAEHGEPLQDAVERLLSLSTKAARQLVEEMKKEPRGRRPGKRATRTAEYATWLYRVEINREKIGQIAQEYHASEHVAKGVRCSGVDADHGMIRQGINKARYLLSLAVAASSKAVLMNKDINSGRAWSGAG